MKFNVVKDDFKLLKNIPVIPRIILIVLLLIGGLLIQFLMPINGRFPFEQQEIMFVPFILGFVLLLASLFLIFPERLIVSEEPKLSEESSIWSDTNMKQLSNVFNLINKRKKEAQRKTAFFDLSTARGKITFPIVILSIAIIYILIVGLSNRLFSSTLIFLVDIYLFIIPLWFIVRVKEWNPDILRKILFFYQFSKDDNLDEVEFSSSAAVQLQKIADKSTDVEVLMPINVRFMVEFDDAPEVFDSLSIQITINEYMKNKYPYFVCFLRMRKPRDWKPLKKPEAFSEDGLIKIKHMVEEEEEDLHLFVITKSPKVENPNHTSPREATKIFLRAVKMMRDLA